VAQAEFDTSAFGPTAANVPIGARRHGPHAKGQHRLATVSRSSGSASSLGAPHPPHGRTPAVRAWPAWVQLNRRLVACGAHQSRRCSGARPGFVADSGSSARSLPRTMSSGALSADVPALCRLGWESWRGPTYVNAAAGRLRTADEDDGVVVLRTDRTGEIDLTIDLTCDWRSGHVW
jgi:hypothetical protein